MTFMFLRIRRPVCRQKNVLKEFTFIGFGFVRALGQEKQTKKKEIKVKIYSEL